MGSNAGLTWTNSPSSLDPTGWWNNAILPGGSANLLFYDCQPVTDLVTTMQTTLNMEERREMAREVQRILTRIHPDHHHTDTRRAPQAHRLQMD